MLEVIASVAVGTWFVSILFKVEHWLLPLVIVTLCAALLFSTPWTP